MFKTCDTCEYDFSYRESIGKYHNNSPCDKCVADYDARVCSEWSNRLILKCQTCKNKNLSRWAEPCCNCFDTEKYEDEKDAKDNCSVEAILTASNGGSMQFTVESMKDKLTIKETVKNPYSNICNELSDLLQKKNIDYGNSFANLRKELPDAILVRVYDKYSRLRNLISGAEQHIKDESIEDTLMDLAGYCILELSERRKENNERM